MDILGKQTENSGDITENELKDILIKYGALSEDEEKILDKTLTTTKGNYEIPVSEIYNGKLKPPKAGLYNAETDELIYSWDKLLELGNMINVNKGALSRSAFTIPNDIAKVKLVITDDGTVTSITGLQSISKLKEVVIPATVTSISSSAFGGNQDLVSVRMPRGGSELTIGNGAFGGCGNLTSVELLGNVTSIGSAFAGCSSLTSVKISNWPTTIGDSAFQGCTGLTNVKLSDNVVTIGQYAFAACSNLTDFVIPENVTTIGQYAFGGCSGLTSLVIPESVTSLGKGALDSCSNLRELTICGNLTSFIATNGAENPTAADSSGPNGLGKMESLKKITLGSDDVDLGLKTIPLRAFQGFTYVETVEIKPSVTSIGEFAFLSCIRLHSINMSNRLNSIGNHAFNNCSNLESIRIPENITSIGNYAFFSCTSLESIIVNKTNNSISGAPWGAPNMTSNDVVWNE